MALHYRILGKGEAVLWIHGFGEDSRVWEGYVDDTFSQFKNIIPDLPGFGKSDADKTPTSIDQMAIAVKAVLDKEGVDRVNVIGHSMGGYIALALVANYPGLVSRLCLFHSQPFADSDEKKQGRKKLIDFLNKNGLEPWVKEFYPALFAEGYRKNLSDTIKKLMDRGSQYRLESVVNATEAMIGRADRSEALAGFGGPVLFIVGNEDAAIPEKNSLEQLDLPDTAFAEMLDNVAHMGMFEAPAETKKAIYELLTYATD